MDTEKNEKKESEASPFLDFLETENGAKIADKVIAAFESMQHKASVRDITQSKYEQIIACIIVLCVISAVSALTFFDKFTPSLGVLFGSLVGYIYGKNKS